MNRLFKRSIQRQRPTFGVAQGHFYFVPVTHVLCGFLFESSRGGAYIWRYAFPLFDHRTHISLEFAERLPNPHGFIETADVGPAEQAAEFLKRIAPYEEQTAALQDLAIFRYYVSSSTSMDNPWVQRGYALTLIMLGESEEAAGELRALLRLREADCPRGFREDMVEVSQKLALGLEEARTHLERWEMHTRSTLGIA